MDAKTPLDAAISAAGSQAALATKVGVKQQTISYWVKKGQVPAEMALAVERATGVPRHVLRPDLFDAPTKGVAA
jgi:DNA-binding transcriptional regulator YdaS (Cro superfamily)